MHRSGIIDAWMQHPSSRWIEHPIFDSLWRWLGEQGPHKAISLEETIGAMNEAGVQMGLISAWWGPQGPLIDNDEVAGLVRAYPGRLVGVASVDLSRPLAAVRELRRCVRQLGF